MPRSLILKDTHPPKAFASITQVGLKATSLALEHQEVIDARLPGTLDRLTADLVALGVVVPGTVQVRHEARVATTLQNSLLEQGYARVRAIRETVRKAGAPKDVRRAYGVGQVTDRSMVRHVKAALQQIINRATSTPEEAAEFGFTPEAVTELQTFLASFTEATQTQQKKRAHSPLSTKARNLTANRVLQAAVLIAGAGMLAFVADPLTHASFEALMNSTKRTGTSKAKPPPDGPEGSEPG